MIGRRRHLLEAVLAGLLLLLLPGCDMRAGYAEYEVIYPSGWSRDPFLWEDCVPVEGTSLYLQRRKAEDHERTYGYDLLLLDGEGSLICAYPEMGHDTMRGAAGEDGTVWICGEGWDTPHFNGYMDGWLQKGVLLLVEETHGSILFEAETEENEFYLASAGMRCYFYASGEDGQDKWSGLVGVPERKARVYYRELSDWDKKNTVYTMEYARHPQAEGEWVDRIRFYLEEDRIRIVLADYELVEETGHWDYVEKACHEVPLSSPLPFFPVFQRRQSFCFLKSTDEIPCFGKTAQRGDLLHGMVGEP